jgi:DNA-binding transcriptional ArsR family regulator
MSTFTALTEPNRRLLVDELRDGARTVNTLVDAIGLTQPAVSKHLRILREGSVAGMR